MCENNYLKVLNIGSCDLHVVHNSFRSGMQKAEWNINQFLISLYCLLKEVPLIRADYIEVTGSTLLPLMFSDVRWIENQ